jgi:hypothetical protein
MSQEALLLTLTLLVTGCAWLVICVTHLSDEREEREYQASLRAQSAAAHEEGTEAYELGYGEGIRDASDSWLVTCEILNSRIDALTARLDAISAWESASMGELA